MDIQADTDRFSKVRAICGLFECGRFTEVLL